jgi:hypothetical protein
MAGQSRVARHETRQQRTELTPRQEVTTPEPDAILRREVGHEQIPLGAEGQDREPFARLDFFDELGRELVPLKRAGCGVALASSVLLCSGGETRAIIAAAIAFGSMPCSQIASAASTPISK